ncbi:MAG: septation protein SepH, partial [Nocardioides sp.]|uniref:septation protein SepH n=1 Tax=Nocardioides sp. TaxID=35761 RepID=UPI0039E5F4AA
MSAEELPRELPGTPAERVWTVASISRDGTRMLLVDADGNEMSVAVAPDALPRRSEMTVNIQGNPQGNDQGPGTGSGAPALRPRDMQARIRAGESPESVAEAAGTTLERIMPFAAPVVAEREHMAERAQKATVRRIATESTARSLGDAVAMQLATTDSVGDAVEWDAWRRTDGRWALVALYTTSGRSGAGEFTFDPPGNYVSLDNDDARWIVGDLPAAEQPDPPVVDDLTAARERRQAPAEGVAAPTEG